MKFTKLLFFFLLAIIATTAILSFMLPTSQKVERSIVINAPAAVIYTQLMKLETFNQFSVWSRHDSSAVYTLTGTDGTIGATSSWVGHRQISGEGKIEIIALEPNRKVVHRLSFIQPKKGNAESVFNLVETNKAITTVTWTFRMATPRPRNIFNLLHSLDKEKGKDFEEGLRTLKKMVEQAIIPVK